VPQIGPLGLGPTEEDIMEIIRQTLAGIEVGTPVSFRELTLFPLLGPEVATPPDYATLDEALAGGWARVTELSAAGSVPELRFVNEGDRAVFMLDGEELVGAKQNRVLNLTILAPAGKTLVIPVSCVERGRWAAVSRQFASSPSSLYARARMLKMRQVSVCMENAGGRRSDQGALWDEIAACSERLGVHSPTGAMAHIYEQAAPRIEDYVRAFEALPNQVGALFAFNGRLFGLDLFDHPKTLARLLPKLVRSYALDALDAPKQSFQEPPVQAASDLLAEVADCRAQAFDAVGAGEDVRLHGPHLTGAALIAERRIVHLSAFRHDNGDEVVDGRRGGRMLRASLRGSASRSRDSQGGGRTTADGDPGLSCRHGFPADRRKPFRE